MPAPLLELALRVPLPFIVRDAFCATWSAAYAPPVSVLVDPAASVIVAVPSTLIGAALLSLLLISTPSRVTSMGSASVPPLMTMVSLVVVPLTVVSPVMVRTPPAYVALPSYLRPPSVVSLSAWAPVVARA